MSRRENLVGKTFGRLKVIELDKTRTTTEKTYWLCKCNCENENLKSIYSYQLTSGKTKSCGCLQKEIQHERTFKHGSTLNHTKDRLYNIWDGMLQRCNNEKNKRYKNYGGRGISVCSNWLDFINFKNWALTNGYKDDLTIERKNVDGNYESDNCIWITLSEQSRNKTNTKYVIFNNQKVKLLDLLDELNIKTHYKKILHRINDLEWDINKAIQNL